MSWPTWMQQAQLSTRVCNALVSYGLTDEAKVRAMVASGEIFGFAGIGKKTSAELSEWAKETPMPPVVVDGFSRELHDLVMRHKPDASYVLHVSDAKELQTRTNIVAEEMCLFLSRALAAIMGETRERGRRPAE